MRIQVNKLYVCLLRYYFQKLIINIVQLKASLRYMILWTVVRVKVIIKIIAVIIKLYHVLEHFKLKRY